MLSSSTGKEHVPHSAHNTHDVLRLHRDHIVNNARSATARTTMTGPRASSARGADSGRSGSRWVSWRSSGCWESGGTTGNGHHDCCSCCFGGGTLGSRSSGFGPSSSSCLHFVSLAAVQTSLFCTMCTHRVSSRSHRACALAPLSDQVLTRIPEVFQLQLPVEVTPFAHHSTICPAHTPVSNYP